MKQPAFLGYSLMIIVMCLPTAPLGSGLDAFVLAVQHFDPDHETGIEYESEEVEFMRQVLWEARKSVPEVAGLHVAVDGTVQSKFGPSMYRSLRVKFRDGRAARSDEDIAAMRKIGESTGQGCRHEEQVNRVYGSNRLPRTKRLLWWDLGRSCREEADQRLCENSDVVEWLCSLGVESVTLTENEYKGSRRAELFLSFQHVVDLEFCAKRLAGDPDYASVFHDFELVPYDGNVFGDGPTVRVVPEGGLSGFNGVRVEFSVGWGDCPAGCIYRHFWVFEYRVEGERTGKEWPLSGGLIEETGDPLPGHTWSKLRSAEVVR